MSVSVKAHGSRGHDVPLELELQVLVSFLAWVLGTTGPGSLQEQHVLLPADEEPAFTPLN